MNVVVFGASGRTGRLVVEQALDKGHSVTAFVRRSLDGVSENPKLQVAVGDAADAGAVDAAIAGQDAVVSVVGPNPRRPDDICSLSADRIIASMKRRGVARLIVVTAATDIEGGFLFDKIVRPLFMREIYEDKERQEMAIFKSGLDWTIVRPPVLRDGPRTGSYRLAVGSAPKGGWRVSRGDLADFIVRELPRKDYIHQALVITY
ncbi:MAG: NAD(P)H-binding protein [Candidatus Eremiobacteraeota bacterium]|nr:NAD(P)H-binding protein [Candidatus Eremiobacteraeota bacterium]